MAAARGVDVNKRRIVSFFFLLVDWLRSATRCSFVYSLLVCVCKWQGVQGTVIDR